MKKPTDSLRILPALFLSACAGFAQPAAAAEIEPPNVQLVDKFGVNMANGQVTHSMEIVSIGGGMGLSDRISVRANEFDFIGYRGFNHKYYAKAKNVEFCTNTSCSPRNVMRVYDSGGSADFAYYFAGTMQQTGAATTGYTYVAVGDERHTLEAIGNNLVWIKPDGTVVTFDRSTNSPKPASQGGTLTSIVFPSGFTVTVTTAGLSVNSNTGFQLKRVFEADTRPIDKPGHPAFPSSATGGWSGTNPKYVYGVNAAIEWCSWGASTCSFTNTWPRATFDWPPAMPRTMRIGTTSVNVTTALGITTTYGFTAYDLAYNETGQVVPGFTAGVEFSPRLTSVSAPNNSGVSTVTYDYKNLFSHLSNDFGGSLNLRLQTSGVTKRANRDSLQVVYDMMRPYYTDHENTGSGINGLSFVRLRSNVSGAQGAIHYAETQDGRVTFEMSARNFPVGFQKTSAPFEGYLYTRGNLTKIIYNGHLPTTYYIEAEYPAACTASTRKTCNQATRIRDARGNWTDYTYHAPSGQVATVTYPANKHGIRAQTRYTYAEKTAQYYGSGGTWITGTPIWLKTEEEYCIKSAASAGGCTEADEVVTRFEYNHNNLLMTGMAVQEPGGVIRRTCYRYDKYGNQIGVTTPNANLGSCP